MSNEQKIREIIADTLCVDLEEVIASANLVDDLGADSLDLVELIMGFEEAFDIEIADEVAEKITNVAEIVNHINELTENI